MELLRGGAIRHVLRLSGVLLDIDGTLLDSNDAHAHAWVEALAEQGVAVSFERVRPLIGMGSDKVAPMLTGFAPDDPRVEQVAERRGELFRARYLPDLQPFPGARGLVVELGRRGLCRVVATSASADDVRGLLEQATVADAVDIITSKDDVDRSKPDPDILCVALAKARLEPAACVMVGDTPYDVEAAERARVPAIAVRTGGWPDAALRGAAAIVDDVAALEVQLDEILARVAG